MFWNRKKADKPDEDGDIIYLHKPEPCVCGGNTTTLNKKAPRTIESHEMVFFEVFSALNGEATGSKGQEISYISAFAAPDGEGTFVFLEESEWFGRGAEREHSAAWVKGDIFPALADIAEKYGFVKNNGYSSHTAGLPDNFGGVINIKYASGEWIKVSDNQSAVISAEAATEIAKAFCEAMKGERLNIPKAEDITAIRYDCVRKDGGYTKAELTVLPDGTAVNRRESKYDGPQVYNSEKPVDAETVAEIKKNIDETALLAWGGLPGNGFDYTEDSQLSFVLKDGREITVRSGREIPDRLRDGFFNVQLEITT